MKYKLHYCRDIITRNTKNKLLLQDYAFKKNFTQFFGLDFSFSLTCSLTISW